MIKIGLDFDGTCVTHEYPKIGKDIGAIPVLKKMINSGCKLILNTMRSGNELEDAINWFIDNGIELYSVGFDPEQKNWTSSNKCYAELYIDDAALGAPLKRDSMRNDDGDIIYYGRPYIDWVEVEKYLVKSGII